MTAQLQLRRCQPSEARSTVHWIAEYHYLKSAPPGFVQVLEFNDSERVVGAMIMGRPAAKTWNAESVLQLHRMYFIDDTPTNTESRALAMMRRHIRIWIPQIKMLLSYSDPTVGHLGMIYKADGWADVGVTRITSGYGWRSRGGDRSDSVSSKTRWMRTP